MLLNQGPAGGLRAWSAVSGSDVFLETMPISKAPGIWKYERPAIGDGRLYVLDASGTRYCMGT
jgi:hypothetical protein